MCCGTYECANDGMDVIILIIMLPRNIVQYKEISKICVSYLLNDSMKLGDYFLVGKVIL